jgi:phenylalanyl-tRNA synthetase beta chain
VKVPLSWLQQFVAVDMPLGEFVEFIGRSGLEVDDVHTPGAGARDVITARVLDRQPHPDADKLQVVRVTHGDDEVELVCGAWNFEVGDVVLHAQPGGAIPGLELEARKIRGVVSNGMLCSAKELQLGDDHSGIMRLDPDTPLGVDAHDLLPLGEPVIDIAVMADRGDHLSILGVAREVAALLGGLEVHLPPVAEVVPGRDVPITIDAPDACSQFVAWTLADLQLPATSPWWMRQRLAQCGVRSISPIVDITNLVMLELGQPMHAYDLNTLAGPELRVRWATDGEFLTTLDDVDRPLRSDDLVVADADRAVGLAGVMGGANTEVSDTTTAVVFEAATWDPATVRRTSRRLRLVSEASSRFERGVDAAGAERACARAVHLALEMGTATDRGVTRAGTDQAVRPVVTVDPAWVRSFIGLDDLTDDRQAQVLTHAGCRVSRDDGQLAVTPPSWRTDLTRPADVAEEAVRLHGYDQVPATLPLTGVTGGLTASQRAERDVRDAVRSFGLHEAVTRPFVGEQHLDGVHPGGDPVVLANPLAQDASAMRPSTVEGLLQAVRHNVGQGAPGVALFEMGRIFRRPAARWTTCWMPRAWTGGGSPRTVECCRPSPARWAWPYRAVWPPLATSTVTGPGVSPTSWPCSTRWCVGWARRGTPGTCSASQRSVTATTRTAARSCCWSATVRSGGGWVRRPAAPGGGGRARPARTGGRWRTAAGTAAAGRRCGSRSHPRDDRASPSRDERRCCGRGRRPDPMVHDRGRHPRGRRRPAGRPGGVRPVPGRTGGGGPTVHRGPPAPAGIRSCPDQRGRRGRPGRRSPRGGSRRRPGARLIAPPEVIRG